MTTKKTKESATQKWAKKNKKTTSSQDVPGSGMAKGAAKAIEERKKKMTRYMDSI